MNVSVLIKQANDGPHFVDPFYPHCSQTRRNYLGGGGGSTEALSLKAVIARVRDSGGGVSAAGLRGCLLLLHALLSTNSLRNLGRWLRMPSLRNWAGIMKGGHNLHPNT